MGLNLIYLWYIVYGIACTMALIYVLTIMSNKPTFLGVNVDTYRYMTMLFFAFTIATGGGLTLGALPRNKKTI
jgi:hypothetical protein